MKNVPIKGIIPPIVTPMSADESVNIPELRNQIERQIAGGVHGIFPFGTNGEGYILSMKEKEEVPCMPAPAVSLPVIPST